jgi:hypothetical protein
MRLIIIIIILLIGICSIEGRLNTVNYNLEKIIKLLEAKGDVK